MRTKGEGGRGGVVCVNLLPTLESTEREFSPGSRHLLRRQSFDPILVEIDRVSDVSRVWENKDVIVQATTGTYPHPHRTQSKTKFVEGIGPRVTF